MTTIDFKTSHNITINFVLASVLERAIAFAIDFIIIYFSCLLIAIAFRNLDFLMIILILPFAFYSMLFELFNMGQSIGKRIMKIRVVNLSGNNPGTKSYLLRWIFRLVDIYLSLGTVAIISIFSSTKGQRLGDLLANTTVVKIKSRTAHDLYSLEKLNSFSVDIQYAGVTKYTDEDMLLIKNVIKRCETKASDENLNLAHELVVKLYHDLELRHWPNNEIEFLNQVLKEYIVLTR